MTSHGSAGDHWFDWLAKSLNVSPEIMIYMGDTVRAKYLKERSRKERADIFAFTEFLIDVGAVYTAIGECYAYRSYQLEALIKMYNDQIRFVNIVRHPYCWLGFYVDWRCSNMNMPAENTQGVAHEWSVVCHDEIAAYHLKPYKREDVHIWSSYQGMLILNRMITDIRPGVINHPLEKIVSDPNLLQEIVAFLTHNSVQFTDHELEIIYSWVDTPFIQERKIRHDPELEYQQWPDWKQEAFEKIVTKEVRDMFTSFGYHLI